MRKVPPELNTKIEKQANCLFKSYYVILFAFYIFTVWYILCGNFEDDRGNIYYSILPLIITGLMGTLSKSLLFSLLDIIHDNSLELMSNEVKRSKSVCEATTNILTVVLIIIYLMIIAIDSKLYLTVVIVIGVLLVMLFLLSLHYRNTNLNIMEKYRLTRIK